MWKVSIETVLCMCFGGNVAEWGLTQMNEDIRTHLHLYLKDFCIFEGRECFHFLKKKKKVRAETKPFEDASSH